jgi:hypothetical protein
LPAFTGTDVIATMGPFQKRLLTIHEFAYFPRYILRIHYGRADKQRISTYLEHPPRVSFTRNSTHRHQEDIGLVVPA